METIYIKKSLELSLDLVPFRWLGADSLKKTFLLIKNYL